jgi:hypothetical protein
MFLILLAVIWLIAFVLTAQLHRRRRLRSAWHFDVVAFGLLALATLGFFWRIVAGLNWMPADGGDLVSFLFPTYRFAAASLRDGAWPLWNPHVYAGAPHVGDIQAGFLYLPNLLLFLLNPDFPYETLQWLSMAHLWFAGVGMVLLLARGLGLRRVAGLAGALAFMFSDAFLTHFGNLNLNAALSWLPWVFWAWIGSRNAFARVGLTAALLALSITAGHIQATLFIILALGLFTLFAALAHRDQPGFGRSALEAAVALALVVALACLLAAPVLLPALELAGRTMRAAGSYTATGDYPLPPAQLIGWLIPGFFGRGPQFHWGVWPRVEVGYLGVLPLVLAALGVALAGRSGDRRIWPWAGLAGVTLLLALGVYAILYGWLTLLPGFNQLRAAARFVALTGFAISALAAFGLDALLRPLTPTGERILARAVRLGAWAAGGVLLVGLPLAYLALVLLQDREEAIVTRTSITLIGVVSFALLLAASVAWLAARRWRLGRPVTLAWLAVALIFVDVASLGAYQDMGATNPGATHEQGTLAAYLAAQPGPFRIDTRTQIDALWQPSTAMLYGLEDVNGVANPLVLADFERYWQALGSRSTPLYDLLNVRYVLGRKDVVLDWDKFALAYDGDPDLNVYENRNALPRAFVAPTIQFQPTADLALQAITQPGFDPKQTVVITGPSTLPVPVGGGGTITDLAVSRNAFRFRVDADAPALIFMSQVWYPGWRVFVDGQDAGEPYRANFLFQAAGVPGGQHEVEVRFRPVSWRAGWLLMAAGVLIFVAAGLWLARAKRTRGMDHGN